MRLEFEFTPDGVRQALRDIRALRDALGDDTSDVFVAVLLRVLLRSSDLGRDVEALETAAAAGELAPALGRAVRAGGARVAAGEVEGLRSRARARRVVSS